MAFSIGSQKVKSRTGAISTNVETLLKQTVHDKRKQASVFHSFSEAMVEKLAVSMWTRQRKAAVTEAKERFEPHNALEAAAVTAATTPVMTSLQRGAKGFVDTGGGLNRRVAGALEEVTSVGARDIAAEAFGAAANSTAINAGKQGVEYVKHKALDNGGWLRRRRKPKTS